MADRTADKDLIARLEKRLDREKRARQEAEKLLEQKSLELYAINKKLHEETRLLEATVVNAKDGIIITDSKLDDDGPRIIYVNNAFTRLSGYEADEVIGKTPRILQGPNTCKKTLARLKTSLQQGKYFQGELENYTKDGDPYWLEISITPVKNNDGVITHFTAIERNISERKAFEKELEESRLGAEKANLAKSEFLANMSHELRTPMNGIIGLSDLLFDTQLDEEQTESVKAINSSAESLLILLNDILDFSKIEAGEMALENVAFNIRHTVEEIVSLIKNQADDKNIELTYNFAPSVPEYAMSDSTRIRQILTNLISNAIKFTQEGSISIDVSTKLSGTKPTLYFRVEDTGIGIPKEKLEAIFLKFTQADESTARRFGGTGLGLTISKTLVEMMGGQIGVDSILGEGSTFWFELPLVRAREELIQKNDTTERSYQKFDGEGLRVLVVDDHPVNLMFARKILKKLGIDRIQLANSGEEAFEYTQVAMYDAIFMDCQMPGMDGFQTTQAIRSMHKGRALHTPIIAVTANAMKGDRERCIEAGMDDYLSKPIKPANLSEVIAKWVKARPADDKIQKPLPPSGILDHVILDENAPLDLEHFNFMFEDSTVHEIQELIDLFNEQALLSIDSLEKNCLDGPQEEWKKSAHKLKGSAANMGAVYLSKAAETAEHHMDATQQEKRELLAVIFSEFVRLKNYFVSAFNNDATIIG